MALFYDAVADSLPPLSLASSQRGTRSADRQIATNWPRLSLGGNFFCCCGKVIIDYALSLLCVLIFCMHGKIPGLIGQVLRSLSSRDARNSSQCTIVLNSWMNLAMCHPLRVKRSRRGGTVRVPLFNAKMLLCRITVHQVVKDTLYVHIQSESSLNTQIFIVYLREFCSAYVK